MPFTHFTALRSLAKMSSSITYHLPALQGYLTRIIYL